MRPAAVRRGSRLPELRACERRENRVRVKLRTCVSFADEQSATHTGRTTIADDAVLGAPWRVTPDGLDGAAGCPMPGSVVGLGTVAPCSPYVPFLCDVANADLGAKDESFEQGEEGRSFGRGRVVVDEIGG